MTDLSFLPETADPDHLAQLLLKYLKGINEFCGTNMEPVLQRFHTEEDIPQSTLHDYKTYITILFSQERASTQGKFINPRDVVTVLKEALDIVREAFPSGVLADARIKELMSVSHLTLDWNGPTDLYPALRYAKNDSGVTVEQVQEIVGYIRQGRGKRPAFGKTDELDAISRFTPKPGREKPTTLP